MGLKYFHTHPAHNLSTIRVYCAKSALVTLKKKKKLSIPLLLFLQFTQSKCYISAINLAEGVRNTIATSMES